MAEKKPDRQAQFNEEVFRLGLTLIEDYRAGRCRDSNKTIEAIIEIFKVQPKENPHG